MASIEWAVICVRTSRSGKWNLLTLHDVFRHLIVETVPARGAGVLVVRIAGRPGEAVKMTLRARRSNGAVEWSDGTGIETVIGDDEPTQSSEVLIPLDQFQFEAADRYRLELAIPGAPVWTMPLVIQLERPEK